MERVISGFKSIILGEISFNVAIFLLAGLLLSISFFPPMPEGSWLWEEREEVPLSKPYKAWVLRTGSTLLPQQPVEAIDEETVKSNIAPLKIMYHKVRPGETLWSIAHKYGVDFYTVVDANKDLKSINNLKVGQIIKVPNHSGIFYKMRKGDTINSVANKYRVDVEDLLAVNNVKSGSELKVGEVIFLPGATSSIVKRLLLSNYIGNGFIWPLKGRIASGFGWRINPISRRREFHEGIDIAAPWGTRVVAARSGRVIFAGWYGGFGKTVKILHSGGWMTLYGHLSRIYVRAGWYVKRGRVIGKVGNSGYSTGPHLHFGLYKYGRAVNPFRYLR